MKTLPDKLKECRASLGLTQGAMAKKVGVESAATIQKYEAGIRNIVNPVVARAYVKLGNGLIRYEDFFEKRPN